MSYMSVEDIKSLAESQPFRPFAVRLHSGVQYNFTEPRAFGAPRDYHVIYFFGQSESVRIDTASISGIIEQQ